MQSRVPLGPGKFHVVVLVLFYSVTRRGITLRAGEPVRMECRNLSSCFCLRNLQWATKVVETLLGNDAFPYLSSCSILFASSFNSLVPPAPQFNLVKALWSVQSKNWQNQHCFGGKGRKCDQDAPKSNFNTKCLNTFVAHCSFALRNCMQGGKMI